MVNWGWVQLGNLELGLNEMDVLVLIGVLPVCSWVEVDLLRNAMLLKATLRITKV